MPEKDKTPVAVATPSTPAVPGAVDANGAPIPPKRSPGHRGADVKDTVAEMAAKAHEISLEAGSKMAAAMKEVIGAAAGLTGFAIESARDLVQYMVRRGQMTQDEADKLIREAEEFQSKRKGSAPAKAAAAAAPKSHSAPKAAAKPAAKKPAVKPAPAKKPAAKAPAAKKAVKPVAKKSSGAKAKKK